MALVKIDNGPKLAYLWGNMQGSYSNGIFVKLSVGIRLFHSIIITSSA